MDEPESQPDELGVQKPGGLQPEIPPVDFVPGSAAEFGEAPVATPSQCGARPKNGMGDRFNRRC